jgi:hypothetical protein
LVPPTSDKSPRVCKDPAITASPKEFKAIVDGKPTTVNSFCILIYCITTKEFEKRSNTISILCEYRRVAAEVIFVEIWKERLLEFSSQGTYG